MRMPPQPVTYRMTDRDDGTLWYLTFDDATELIAIDTDAPSGLNTEDLVTFAAFEGPFIQTHRNGLRLLIRGGYLGYEMVPDPYDLDGPRVYAGAGRATTRYEIVDGQWAMDGDTIGYVVP